MTELQRGGLVVQDSTLDKVETVESVGLTFLGEDKGPVAACTFQGLFITWMFPRAKMINGCYM